jgi:hypothetical protein
MKSKLLSIKPEPKRICSLVVMLVTLTLAIPAQAQLDPGIHDVFQTNRFGERVKRERYSSRGAKSERPTTLSTGCCLITTSTRARKNPVVTTISASGLSYQSEEEFFARVAWDQAFAM